MVQPQARWWWNQYADDDWVNILTLAAYLQWERDLFWVFLTFSLTSLSLSYTAPILHTCQFTIQTGLELQPQALMPCRGSPRHTWTALMDRKDLLLYSVKICFPTASTAGSSSDLGHIQSKSDFFSLEQTFSCWHPICLQCNLFQVLRFPHDIVSSAHHHSDCSPLNIPVHLFILLNWNARMEDNITWVGQATKKPRLWSPLKVIDSCNTA